MEQANDTNLQYGLDFLQIREMLKDCSRLSGAVLLADQLSVSSDPVVIRRKLKETTLARDLLMKKGTPSFGGVSDIRPIVSRADKGALLSLKELLEVSRLLKAAASLISYEKEGRETEEDELNIHFRRLLTHSALLSRIDRSVLTEDLLADDASPELYEVRRKIHALQGRIKETLQKYINSSSKILQENIVTTRNGRYVLPVKAEYKSEIRGIVHDTSSSGSTIFVEPMSVVDMNNEIREYEGKENAEIEKILYSLTSDVSSASSLLLSDYDNIIEICHIFARAELSIRMNGVEPVITEERAVKLDGARHPLIDPKKVVPISLSVGNSQPMMIITGPNTGGKTVTLKTIGLFCMMAQSGLHIPAKEGSSLCVFDRIFMDIGDEQSIEQSLSTFSGHMKNIIRILEEMTLESLVLFDELGSGTDPVEGAALASAILETVLRVGPICACSTHFAELKMFAIERPEVQNASCEFDLETLQPTYRLMIGTPGKSNAFAISQKLGLPESVIQLAESKIDDGSRSFENTIAKLESSRQILDREIEAQKKSREEYEAFRKKSEEELKRRLSSAEKEAETLKNQAQQIMDSARVTSQYILSQLDEARKDIDSAKAAEALNERKKAIRDRVAQYSEEVLSTSGEEDDYVLPRDPVKGDIVRHRNLGLKGTVVEGPDRKGLYTVLFGNVKMKISKDDIRLLEEETELEKKTEVNRKKNEKELRVKSFHPELDIRGQTGDDGCFMLDHYLDEAVYSGIQSVRIIHGKGTGALRTAVWNYLKGDRRVESFRNGNPGEGDYGVTVVNLRKK